MKTAYTLTLLLLFMAMSTTKAQTNKETTATEKTSAEPMNLVDEQVKILGGLFSTMDTDAETNPFTGSDNYYQVIDKMDAPEETKNYLREQYQLYELSLDPAKKDSLDLMLDKLMQKSMQQSKQPQR